MKYIYTTFSFLLISFTLISQDLKLSLNSGNFKLNQEELQSLKKNFIGRSINDKSTLKIINYVFSCFLNNIVTH